MDFKILVVDDERMTLELVRDIAEKIGCQVDITGDSSDALELVESGEYGLVITDIRMPGVTGLDILRHVRQADPDCLVVLCTGYATIETAIEAIKAGAYDYITKPFTADELLVVLRNAWDRILLNRKNKKLLEELGDIYKELSRCERSEDAAGKEDGKVSLTYNGRLINPAEPIEQGGCNSLEDIKVLAQLRKEGLISADEYERFKGKILKY